MRMAIERETIFQERKMCAGYHCHALDKKKKKRQITYIAPLQPPTLATFRSWGSSAGAGRVRPAGCKDSVKQLNYFH